MALLVSTADAAESPLQRATWVFAPPDPVWTEYLADPRRPRTAADQIVVFDSDLADELDVGDGRFDLALGERVELLRYAHPEWSLDLAAEAAFFGQFDQSHSTDNIGWDGWYGVHLALRTDAAWVFKLGYRHLSSHLGDEIIERTGIERRGYTREDLSLAVQWTPLEEAVTAYIEVGHLLNEPNADEVEDLVFEGGLQYRHPRAVLWDRWRWEVGVHCSAFEDDDFEPNVNLATRLSLPDAAEREALELHAAVYSGRSQIGELSTAEETHASLGFGWSF